MKKILIGIFLSYSTCFSYSLYLNNNTSYKLTACVESASGELLGQATLNPGEKKSWSDDMNTVFSSNSSVTPFTVSWKCDYEGVYSVVNEVSPGSVCSPQQGVGVKTCKPKPKKDKESSAVEKN